MKDKNEKKEGFKKTKIDWIPEDWELKKIKNFGIVVTGSTPPTKDRTFISETNICLLVLLTYQM
ncbi:MAG: hypothetical protein U5Q03_18955 [Bacteroidota bacterium]|nr:hypothetical protein [Bacteroidota bacterium]